MYMRWLWLCLLGLLLAGTASAQVSRFNMAEKAWLDDHQKLKVGVVSMTPPILFFESGQPMGLAADYLRVLAAKLGLYLDLVQYPDDQRLANALSSGEVDFIGATVHTALSPPDWQFSRPYVTLPAALYSLGSLKGQGMSAMDGLTVSVLAGSIWEEFLPHYLPGTHTLPAKDLDQALSAVMAGRAQVYLGDAASVDYLRGEGHYDGLRKAQDLDLTLDIALATSRDNPTLHTLLQKSLDRFNEDELNDVWSNWPGVENTHPRESGFLRFLLWTLLWVIWSLLLVWIVTRRSKRRLAHHREKTLRSIRRLRRREELLKQKLLHLKHKTKRYRHRTKELSKQAEFMNALLPSASWRWYPASGECLWDEEMFNLLSLDAADFTPTREAILKLLAEQDRDCLESLFDDDDRAVSRMKLSFSLPDGREKTLLQFSHYIDGKDGREGQRVAICWDVSDFNGRMAETGQSSSEDVSTLSQEVTQE
ncbi:MAG: transporter substrate-binding domain-containing protein [Candidatus Thiodiazotropha sp.]